MKTAAVLSAITAVASAHATFQQLWKNGKDLESTCARLPPSNSPVETYTGTALQCQSAKQRGNRFPFTNIDPQATSTLLLLRASATSRLVIP